jgi:hypothetical protein
VFGLGQTITKKATIQAIAQFLNNLNPANLNALQNRSNQPLGSSYKKKDKYKSSKPFMYLTISKLDYILNVFIPFLDSLTFI